MPESPLSFASTSTFRNTLMAKNLAQYTVVGNYTPPTGPLNYEIVLGDSNVIDSPNNLNQTYPDQLYPLNEYGPDGGYNLTIDFNGPPLPVDSNQGPYNPNPDQSQLITLNGLYITGPYIINDYSPENGYNYVYGVTDTINPGQIHLPYVNSFVASSYSPYSILSSDNPTGSDGSLSQDSYIAQLGAAQLQNLFEDRINLEIYQSTVGAVNLNTLQDPFEAALIATGQQPLIYRNWRITVPENSIVAALDFATRLTGSYWPVSLIPGDYYDENTSNGLQSNQTSNALSTVNQLTGGLLGPILNINRNPSHIFLANTGNGQRSALFANLHYNRYSPNYNNEFGGALGVIQGLVNVVNNVVNPNGTITSSYYVGSSNAEPSQITSPANQIPINSFGQQNPSPVYGPSELGQLYEGNIDNIKFGLAGISSENGGGIDGQFIWTSPKYKSNAGFKATPGGGSGSKDDDFNQISSQYQSNESTNLEYKKGSILDNTQKLIDSADNVTGISRLKHVGNAMNQVSKVFHDGYKEMTKGSQVVSYKDNTTGNEAGIEYCRVFTKDTPYYTFADLQKTDGITTSGRRFSYSILDNTYNLNIAPLKNPGSTNIVKNEKGDFYAKKYMFSIENLAWRTSSRPGFTYDELPVCEKGPNGGRVMWFPPYELKFSDTSQADWNPTNFIGRPEPIYTYKNTSRSGQLSWKIIVDSPSVMNIIVDQQLKGASTERVNSILESFFAGCVKFDIYELAKKYNTIPVSELQQIQEALNNPRLTAEELAGIKASIPADNTDVVGNMANSTGGGGGDKAKTEDTSVQEFEQKYLDFAFYFENDMPGPHNSTSNTTTENYQSLYDTYVSQTNIDSYQSKANSVFKTDNGESKTTGFFDTVIKSNFKNIAEGDSNFINDSIKLLEKGYGPISIEMVGSASAVASENYNKALSNRRIDSIKKFFSSKGLEKYITEGKFKVTLEQGAGENIVIPKTSVEIGSGTTEVTTTDSGVGNDVDCTKLQFPDTSVAQNNSTNRSIARINSTSAMACRRVKIKNIKVNGSATNEKIDEPVVIDEKKEDDIVITPIKPTPQKTISTELKKGLSKKILRSLLSECDYFEMIKENEPMVYKSFSEKIKHFNPAFHSMTPEGLNSRLTFLNQCVRPGETIPVIGPDGKPKYNDSVNTAFGAPPVLVLRIGDFYHTKIIPDNVSFSYEPLIYDMNPEGIGVQPMMVNVSLSFKMIGGMGLKEPVDQLQNALSFNYYANTEIYDERAVFTEDTSALDKEVFDAILAAQPNGKANNNVSNQSNGGETIGQIKKTVPVTTPQFTGETGEIFYQKVMDNLYDTNKSYFENITNQLEKILLQYNNGVLQMVNSKRQYTKGNVKNESGNAECEIYGKPDLTNSNELFDLVRLGINNNSNPIIQELFLQGFSPSVAEFVILKQNMIQYIDTLQGDFDSGLATINQDIVGQENNLISLIAQLNSVADKTDGKIVGNKVFIYNISGSTAQGAVSSTSVGVSNTYDEFIKDYKTLPTSLNSYIKLLTDNKVLTKDYTSVGVFKPATDKIGETSIPLSFFMVMARVFTDKNKLQDFKNFVISGPLVNYKTPKDLRKSFDKACDELAKNYEKELKAEEKNFEKFKKSDGYKPYLTGIDKLMYPKGKTRKFNFTTQKDEVKFPQQEKYIKDIYGTVPYGDKANDKNTFDGKINL